MTPVDDRFGDLLNGSKVDSVRRNLIQDLDTTYRVPAPAHVRLSIAHALDTHARSKERRGAPASTFHQRRWVSIATAMALAVAGVLGYVRMEAPAPVSAASVLRQALAARPAATPAQLIHETGTLYIDGRFDLPDQQVFTPPMNLTIDQWTQLDASGAIDRQATTAALASGDMVVSALQIGARQQIYGALHNAITTEPAAPQQNYAWLANPLDISDVPALVASAQSSSSDNLRLLPSQILNGVSTDVIQIRAVSSGEHAFPHTIGVSGGEQITTMYVDAHAYTIRGVDISIVGQTGTSTLVYSMRVTNLVVVPATSAPAGIFTLGAPAGARSLPPLAAVSSSQTAHTAPPQATLLLAQTPVGLQLGQLTTNIGAPYATTSVTYCASGRCASDPPGVMQFVISFAQTQPPSSHIPPPLAMGQAMSLTIVGAPVQAYYVEDSTALGARRLIYLQGTTLVELYSRGLDKTAFFNAVSSLVDVQTHAELIPPKWRDTGVFPARP